MQGLIYKITKGKKKVVERGSAFKPQCHQKQTDKKLQ
jgi:hypothetical protein